MKNPLAILFAIVLPVLFFVMVFTLGAARGQEHSGHAQFHAHYKNWTNKDGHGCCNDQDCAPISDSDERTSRGFLEVKIEGVWCPVLSRHYLKSGNVPDASVAHVCAWLPQARPGLTPCQRLLCYQPKPGI